SEQTLTKTKKSKKEKQWKAESGKPSSHFRLFGDPGKDLVIPVPLGTSVKTDMQQELGEILNHGDKILVARGGPGGILENQFAGQKGETRHIQLLLKLIADVGLVGFPNAGKSTLLRAVSHAKPKIASYPFTTLHPSIGTMKYRDSRQILVADLPGLIEGAWKNVGMGHKFLRHVERTKLLLFVVDVEGFRLGPAYPYRSAIENIILLNRELELYQPELVEKPSVLLINKMDKPNAKEIFELIKEQLSNIKEISSNMPDEMRPERHVQFGEVLSCSAKYDPDSVVLLKDRIRDLIDVYDEQNSEGNTLIEKHHAIK
ncbi:UNVERIFIED_CONTAM: hypothetical protein GTU68_051960, partial [Idotea baltica]|nr:hypothetical protein [Idotea baltica]